MQKAELQKPFEWTWNILDYFQSPIAQDLWPQDQLENWKSQEGPCRALCKLSSGGGGGGGGNVEVLQK